MALQLLGCQSYTVVPSSFSRVDVWAPGLFTSPDLHAQAVAALKACWYEMVEGTRLVKRAVPVGVHPQWCNLFLQWFLPKLQLSLAREDLRTHQGSMDPPQPGYEHVFHHLPAGDACLVLHKQLAQAQGFHLAGKYVTFTLGKDSQGNTVMEYVHRLMLWAKEGLPPNALPAPGQPAAVVKVGMHTGPEQQDRRSCKAGTRCVHPRHMKWGSHKDNTKAYLKSKKRARVVSSEEEAQQQ